ncbi:outer membrane autotransporter barrel domain protein [[Enterobacter] lignolyticus SCF1]|uniref:Outer membrane autotransporter barrel domain protein n=2 Tax=[Enterobacter] lignolyticus TaxID=1334193 RepID=E3G4G2_ENTLS|nr:outer membrane autotransporter barrel domain protein [[Enterobacter] lignolyticus SCF1]
MSNKKDVSFSSGRYDAMKIKKIISLKNMVLATSAVLSMPALAVINNSETIIDNGAAVTVPGSQSSPWTLPGALYVGMSGTGTLTVNSGAVVSSGTDNTADTSGSVLGYDSGSSGTVIIDGGTWYDGVDAANNSLTNGTTAVGGSGTGNLQIKNGGKVALVFLNIGQNGSGNGTVTVDGAGSQLLATATSTSGITVGNNGTGVLNITNGGSAIGNVLTYIGLDSNATGTVNVSGAGSTFTVADGIIVGANGTGTMNIADGGKVTSGGGSIAGGSGSNPAGGTGTVHIDGSGSLWDIGNSILSIGSAGTGNGTLIVSNQGTLTAGRSVDVNAANGRVVIGGLPGSAPVAAGILNTPTLNLLNSNSSLILNHSDTSGNYIFSPVINGSGNVSSLNGTTVFNTVNTYTGTTTIDGGTVVVGDATHPGAVLNGASAGDVTVSANGTLSGTGTVNGMVVNTGRVAAFNTLAGNNTAANSNLTLAGGMTNGGVINLAGSKPGNTLTVGKTYIGNNGTIVLNTWLGGDNSPTDKVILDNAQASGTTNLLIKHAGGNGAQTQNGILLVDAQNGSTTAADAFTLSPSSDGYRQGKGTIAAGAYDYRLARGGNGGNAQSWYLTSLLNTPAGKSDPAGATDPGQPGATGGQRALRAETGSYIDNIRAANTLFSMTLHDRLGETQYLDDLSGGKEKATSLWLRNIGGHNRSDSGNGQIATQANRYVMQLGGDLADWSSDGQDRYLFGVMGGYANQHSNSISNVSGYNSKGTLSGYSAGVYGTWYANDALKQGLYVDSWALYNWFNNSVTGEGLPTENYKSDGFTASVETGYTHKTGEYQTLNGMTNEVFIQPQAQLTWMGVTASRHTEQNGTVVESTGDNNLQTRLGVRAFIKGRSKLDENTQRVFEPFVEANWIYNTSAYGVNMDGVNSQVAGTRNIGELKAGVEGKMTNQTTFWLNVAQQIGGKGYSDTQGMLGIKHSF